MPAVITSNRSRQLNYIICIHNRISAKIAIPFVRKSYTICSQDLYHLFARATPFVCKNTHSKTRYFRTSAEESRKNSVSIADRYRRIALCTPCA